MNRGSFSLPYPVDPRYRLVVQGRVDKRVNDEDVGGFDESQSLGTVLHVERERSGGRVLLPAVDNVPQFSLPRSRQMTLDPVVGEGVTYDLEGLR